jgi:hypothetical protein
MIKSFEELQAALKLLVPNCDIQNDGTGQLVVYTGLTTKWLMNPVHPDDDDTLVEIE